MIQMMVKFANENNFYVCNLTLIFFFYIAKAKVPYFMLENAFDTSVARRVKRAYTSLDSFGLRTGMYLRRYPLLRTILFIYVVSTLTQYY